MLEAITLGILTFLSYTWWLWLFLILVPIFTDAYFAWKNEQFLRSAKMTMLEILVPREINKSPRAMEQVFMALHGLRNMAGDLEEVWVDGEVPRNFALEIVSLGGEIHFYIRFYYKSRPLVEAAFFSYYPDVELAEVPPEKDYIHRFPNTVGEMYAQGYNLYSTQLVLKKEPAFPIKSYLDFESPDEEKQYDPISALVEVLGQVKKEQIVALQFMIIPADPGWHKKYKKLVEELKESKTSGAAAKKKAATTWDFSTGPLPALATKTSEKKEDTAFGTLMRTPGETDLLKAVEENLSQPAFETVIRMLYFSPQELYYDSFAKRGIVGSFNQYSAQELNGFKANYKVTTQTKVVVKPYIFPKRRVDLLRQSALDNFKKRLVPPLTFMGKVLTSHILLWNFNEQKVILTARALASIFHPPTKMVLTAPHMPRLDSRKAGPPAGLAIFGDENEIERFQ